MVVGGGGVEVRGFESLIKAVMISGLAGEPQARRSASELEAWTNASFGVRDSTSSWMLTV